MYGYRLTKKIHPFHNRKIEKQTRSEEITKEKTLYRES